MSTREAIALAEAAAERARQEAAAGLIKLGKRRGDNSTMSGGKGYLRRGNMRRGNTRRSNMRRGNTRRSNMRRGNMRRGTRKNRRGSRRN
jgi:hypothetical protein